MTAKVLMNLKFLYSKFRYLFNKRDKKLWVFGEWNGKRCCDNGLYFANYIANTHPEIKLVWITLKGTNTCLLDYRVKCIEMDTPLAIKTLRNAGAVFVTHGMPDLTHKDYIYYSGALVVNFWHGIPWKKIQADMYESSLKRNYWKYIPKITLGGLYLSTSAKFDEILHSAFGCHRKDLIKTGYPRMSLFYNDEEVYNSRKKFIEYVRNWGVGINAETRIITYMPTFRDNDANIYSIGDLIKKSTELQTILKNNNAVVVQKSHFVSCQRNELSNQVNQLFIQISDYPTQELLASSDILISDYSSCFFDYLLLDRPIIHFLYDYRYYSKNDRGLYYKKEVVVCGDVAENDQALITAIENNILMPADKSKLRSKRRKEFLEYESKNSCDDIYKVITSVY